TGAAGSANISGTTNRVIKFTGATSGGDSQLVDDGVHVAIGTPFPSALLEVTGAIAGATTRSVTTNTSSDGLVGINGAVIAGGTSSGVRGITGQASGAGVLGHNTNVNGTGVIGAGNGVGPSILVAGSGGAFTGLTTGVYANATVAGPGQAILATLAGSTVRLAYYDGVTMFKVAGVGTVATNVVDVTDPKRDRRITLHAPETPEILFQDFGGGHLEHGRAHIDLDPRLAGTVTIDDKHPLRVFIQLEDDEDVVGVVVKNKSAKGFDVVERLGGTSNAPFQWQVVANRADELLEGGRISHNADMRFEPHAPSEPVVTVGATGATPGQQPDPATGSGASARTTAVPPDPSTVDPAADRVDDPKVISAGCAAGSAAGGGFTMMMMAAGVFVLRRRRVRRS
ncbi:MAG: hypothetical protein JWO36_5598, partial [Myxococcales bacterium]|nr:hypothetical protein [Myxococcales bacterium]